MLIYLLVFVVAWVYLMMTQGTKYASSPVLLACVLAYMAIFIGLGDMIGGYDRYIYGEMFDVIADETRRDANYIRIYYFVNGSEWGYFVWEILVSFVTRNRYIFILLTTLMMYVLYFFAIKRYIHDYPLAVIVFLGFFFYFSITYLRQAIAVGILWNAVDCIWKRNWRRYFLLTALAISFHNSAFIAIPLYFLGTKRYSHNLVVALLSVCLIIGLTPLPQMMLAFSGDVADMSYRAEQYANDVVGVRYDYILQVSVLYFLIYQNRRVLPDNKKTNGFLNLLYAYFGLLLIFIRFGQGGRFGWYMIIAVIYLFTEISKNKNLLMDVKNMVVALSFVLFFRITNVWAFNLTPYKTFLTPGYPSGDLYIYEKWEYDELYTIDKFYR